MNIKRFLLIPAGLLFFIMLIYTSSGYDESRILFIIRNILIFLFLSSIIFGAMVSIKDFLIRKFGVSAKRKTLVQVLVGVLGVMVLAFTGQVQYRIIDIYEIPDMLACDYYDQYSNLIYTSRTNNCPVILNFDHDEDYNWVTIEFFEKNDFKYYIGYYTTVEIHYDNQFISYYEITTLETILESPQNIQRLVQEVIISDDSVTVNQTKYFINFPETDTDAYAVYEFTNFAYQTTSVAQLGNMIDDNYANLIISTAYHFPDSENDQESIIATGEASIFRTDYMVEKTIFPIYISQSIYQVSARYSEAMSTSIFSVYSYITNSNQYDRLYETLEYVDINDQIMNHESVVFPEYYEIETVENNYQYTTCQSKEIIYEIFVEDFLLIEKKYASNPNNETGLAITYFEERVNYFGLEMNYNQMVTDLSDFQYYAIRRNNPLIDYIIYLMEDYSW